MGGKKTASTARKISELHMAPGRGSVLYHLQKCEDWIKDEIQRSKCKLIAGRMLTCRRWLGRVSHSMPAMGAWDQMTLIT